MPKTSKKYGTLEAWEFEAPSFRFACACGCRGSSISLARWARVGLTGLLGYCADAEPLTMYFVVFRELEPAPYK